jgi:hypothetical protein
VGYHCLTTTTDSSDVNLPTTGQKGTTRLYVRKVSGPRVGGEAPGQGSYNTGRGQSEVLAQRLPWELWKPVETIRMATGRAGV